MFSENHLAIYQYLTYYMSLASNNFKGTIINCYYQKIVLLSVFCKWAGRQDARSEEDQLEEYFTDTKSNEISWFSRCNLPSQLGFQIDSGFITLKLFV